MIAAPGATSVSIDVFWGDDTGAAVTGKVAADFPAVKWSGGSNTADTTITLSDLAAITTAHPNDNTAGGVKEREGGVYRLDLPNNVFTAAGRKTITFAEVAGKRLIAPPIDVQYVQVDARQAIGATLTEAGGAGRLAAAISAYGNVATPVFTAASVNQTGDSFARIGAAGAELTAVGDARIANLDATISSRLASASYTAPDNASAQSAATHATNADSQSSFAASYAQSASADTQTLLGRLTDTRAGYLDNLSVGAVATAANQTTILSRIGVPVVSLSADIAAVAAANPGTGSGADEVTLSFFSDAPTNAHPIADADVWVTSDAGGSIVVAGTLQTDSNGDVTFLLDAGDTYYVNMQKDGVNPIRAQSFVAVAD